MPSEPTVLEKWMTPWRMRVYPRALLAAVVLSFVGLLLLSKELMTPQGVPLGGDYPVFYGVGSLVTAGNYSAVFDVRSVEQAQADALRKTKLEVETYHAWVYPPYVALLLSPLAWLPYVPSFILYTTLMMAAAWIGIWLLGRVSPWIAEHRFAAFAFTVSFYPMLRAVTGGQNTALTFMLLCGALAMLSAGRQVAAGVFLGLLMFKPHFALPFFLFIAVAKRWTAVLTGAVVTLLYYVLAAVFFGWGWPADWMRVVVNYREAEGNINGPNLISLLGVCEQLLGPGRPAALVLGAVLSVAVIVIACALFWNRRGSGDLAAAWGVATAGVILASPHSQFYELGLLALPAVLLADRWRVQAAPALLVLWIVPWIRLLVNEPVVQPLFFVAVAGFVCSLWLLRTSKTALQPAQVP